MRIAIFSDAYHPRVSGLVSSIDEFCKGLTKRGHEVRIVCPSYPPSRLNGQPDPFQTIRVASSSAFVSAEDRLAIPWREHEALLELDKFDPQAVHIQTEFSIGILGRKYCRNRGMPVLSTCHTHYEMYMKGYLPLLPEDIGKLAARIWLRSVYAHDDLVITPSRHIRDVMLGYGIQHEYVVIPTGVDETLFFPHPEEAEEFKRKLAVRHAGFGEGPLLVYIGRIGQEKNLTLLADAMVRIVGEAPDTNLLMVGDGPRKAELRQAFRQRGLEEHVAWLGFLPRSRLPAIYSAADIFVFPSKTETQGLVTIEAMLCGTPVVGMNIMGTAEILQGDVGGLLTEDNPLDFAKKVLHLLRDPALRAAKSAEALRHAQRYTIGNSCDQMEQLYTRIFGK